MKFFIYALSATALTGMAALAPAAQANNTQIENALKSRPELSSFYDGLVSTGVINELREGQPYTVFAPTNEAFNKISPNRYPCFYSDECKAEVAVMLRRHIVPGEKHLTDMNPQGGIYSLFSIDNQHLTASETDKDHFMIDGINIKSEHQLLGGELYEINHLIANDRNMAQFLAPEVIVVQDREDAPTVRHEMTVTTDKTTPIPY